MRFSVVVPVLCTFLASACALDGDDTADPHHAGQSYVHVAPELPHYPTSALTRLETATLARRTAMSGESLDGALARVSGNRRIAQKILLLGATGTEPAYQAAKAALDRVGVPYRALLVDTETVTDALLSDGISKCYFSGVIVATGSLGLSNNGVWESGMAPAEWQSLADFEAACSAREVTWYGWPGAEFGLAPTGSFDSNSAVNGTLTAAGQLLFSRVRDNAVIPYAHAYGYRAQVTDPATTVALVQATDGGVLVASHVGADGRETLISTVDASPYLTHSVVLEYDFVRWVTRGLFVGKKRAYMAPQVDDIFLANDMWSTATHVNDPTTELRITGTDMTAFVSWQTARKASLPAGSTFMTDMAFNGVGTLTSEYADTTLLTAARAAGSKLTWLNHTWDHENLDALTRTQVKTEVQKNCNRAFLLGLHGFNCIDLVTPDMSGLTNSAAVLGMLDAGARFVVSDTSITEALRPANPGTNPAFNVGRSNPMNAALYQIPRHPTSIFYDVSTPDTETDEYNTIYRTYYGFDLTYDQILDKDSEFGLFYLLQGDIDPLMFHQANLRKYGSANRSIYGDWIDAVAAKYQRYFDAPILTLSEAQIGDAMIARGKLNACGVTATVVEATGTRSLELHANSACAVPVTGVNLPFSGVAEQYAGESTTTINLAGGQTKTVSLGATAPANTVVTH